MQEGRQFVRHSTDIPVEVIQKTDSAMNMQHLNNVSLGGLAFQSESYWEKDSFLTVRVLTNPPLEITGQVVWCHQMGSYFEVGVEFMEKNYFSSDGIVEEVCQIEMYKKILVELAEDVSYEWEDNTL